MQLRNKAQHLKVSSEFHNKRIYLKDGLLVEEDDSKLKVTVHKINNEIFEADPATLSEYIKGRSDIAKIVLEKVSTREAKRITYHIKNEQNIKASGSMLGSCEFYNLEEHCKAEVTSNEDIKAKEVLPLRLVSEELKDSSEILNKVIDEKDEYKLSEVGYERHEFEPVNKQASRCYFNVLNHSELYNLGMKYKSDCESGHSSFGFCSTKVKWDQQKNILGIASFLGHHLNSSVLIVTGELCESYYMKYIEREKFESEDIRTSKEVGEFLKDQTGCNYLSYEELFSERSRDEVTLENLMKKYDVILWDLPDISVIDTQKQNYFPIIRRLDSVSFVCRRGHSKINELEGKVKYFDHYQVQIKGIVFSGISKNKKTLREAII